MLLKAASQGSGHTYFITMCSILLAVLGRNTVRLVSCSVTQSTLHEVLTAIIDILPVADR